MAANRGKTLHKEHGTEPTTADFVYDPRPVDDTSIRHSKSAISLYLTFLRLSWALSRPLTRSAHSSSVAEGQGQRTAGVAAAEVSPDEDYQMSANAERVFPSVAWSCQQNWSRAV
jgi:hypothetical protein